MGKNKQIEKPHLILCEGADATYFIIEYLKYLIKNGENEFGSFQAMNFGGNEELPRFLKAMPNLPNYGTLNSVTIVRDAESNYNGAVQSLSNLLQSLGFSVPLKSNEIKQLANIKFAFSLFPSLSEHREDGTLEDLYIKNLVDLSCDLSNEIDSFLDRIQLQGRKIPRKHKSKLYTYFAVTDKFTSMKLAEAAGAGAFNFDCKELNSLKKLLKRICS